MNRNQELENSQTIKLPQEFNECLNYGILFNPINSLSHYDVSKKMSASIVIQHWNHSKFLPMLFESFKAMDKTNVDCQFIITDSGSSEGEKTNVLKLLDTYRGILKVDFLYHNLNEQRDDFNKKNSDGTFHGFPYISNSALNYCKNDIHILCDSSNIVNDKWLIGLCCEHYLFFKEKLIIKSMGGDFSSESTIKLETMDFSLECFKLPMMFYGFEAGRGFGWSIKTSELKRLGGFRHLLSSCGGVDDCFWYRAKLDGFKFFGNNNSMAAHRIHSEGYETNLRKPDWAYKQLKRIYITNKENNPIIPFESIKPKEVYKNYED